MAKVTKTKPAWAQEITRSYNVNGGELRHGDEVLVSLETAKIHESLKAPAFVRYFMDTLATTANSATKADGATLESMKTKVSAVLAAIYDGSQKFRQAQGEAGLSDEQEHAVIVDTLVGELGKFKGDKEKALAWVQSVFAKVTDQERTDKKTGEKSIAKVRTDYNTLRGIPEVRAAIAKAQPTTTETGKVKSLFEGIDDSEDAAAE